MAIFTSILFPTVAPGVPVLFPTTAMMPSPLLADITQLPLVAIIAVGGSFVLTAIIITLGLGFARRREELWHETARIALEKGQPIPLMGDQPPGPASAKPETNDVRSGLILIGVGAGLYLLFISLFGGWLKYVGTIPGFIGVALILNAILDALLKRKNTSSDQLPRT